MDRALLMQAPVRSFVCVISLALTADCGSCHVASRALRNARTQRALETSTHVDAYSGNPGFDLRRVDAVGDDPRAMRSFGYFGAQSALSQRTINESAEVAEALSR